MFTIMEINRDYNNEVMDQDDFVDKTDAIEIAKQNCSGPWCIVDRDHGTIEMVGKGFKNRDYGRVLAFFAWGSCNDGDFDGSPEFDQYNDKDFDMYDKRNDLLKYDWVSENKMKINENTKVTLTIGQLRKLIKEGVNHGHLQLDRLINNAGRLKANSKHSGRLSDRGSIKADVHVIPRDDTKPTGYETFDIEVKKGTSRLLNPSFTFTVMNDGHIFPTVVSGFSDNAGKEILGLIMKVRWDTHDTPKEIKVPTELILRNYAEKHVYFLAFVQGENYMLIPTDDTIPIQKAQELLDNGSGITFGSRDEFISEHPTCIYELKRDDEGRLRGKPRLER